MKKLMFIAAVVAVGLVQAASLDWSIPQKSFLMSDGTTKPNGATVYLFDATAAATFLADLDAGKLGDSISASTLTGASGYLGSGTTYSSTKSTMLNNNYGKAQGTLTVGSVGDYDVVAIILDDGGKYLASSSASGKSYTDNPDDGSGVQFAAANMTSNGWKTYTPDTSGGGGGGVPEPTSGLLLVLGGAMLALRRRRA